MRTTAIPARDHSGLALRWVIASAPANPSHAPTLRVHHKLQKSPKPRSQSPRSSASGRSINTAPAYTFWLSRAEVGRSTWSLKCS